MGFTSTVCVCVAAGISPTEHDNCYGAPAAPIIYICVNPDLEHLPAAAAQKGGAFYMFIAITVASDCREFVQH